MILYHKHLAQRNIHRVIALRVAASPTPGLQAKHLRYTVVYMPPYVNQLAVATGAAGAAVV